MRIQRSKPKEGATTSIPSIKMYYSQQYWYLVNLLHVSSVFVTFGFQFVATWSKTVAIHAIGGRIHNQCVRIQAQHTHITSFMCGQTVLYLVPSMQFSLPLLPLIGAKKEMHQFLLPTARCCAYTFRFCKIAGDYGARGAERRRALHSVPPTLHTFWCAP